LDKLTKLENLSLFNNRIDAIEGLDALTGCLQVLSLGNNRLADLEQTKVLRKFAKLHAVTLAGNPMAGKDEYRPYVLLHLRNLRFLDYRLVDEAEVVQAESDGTLQEKLQEIRAIEAAHEETRELERKTSDRSALLANAHMAAADGFWTQMEAATAEPNAKVRARARSRRIVHGLHASQPARAVPGCCCDFPRHCARDAPPPPVESCARAQPHPRSALVRALCMCVCAHAWPQAHVVEQLLDLHSKQRPKFEARLEEFVQANLLALSAKAAELREYREAATAMQAENDADAHAQLATYAAARGRARLRLSADSAEARVLHSALHPPHRLALPLRMHACALYLTPAISLPLPPPASPSTPPSRSFNALAKSAKKTFAQAAASGRLGAALAAAADEDSARVQAIVELKAANEHLYDQLLELEMMQVDQFIAAIDAFEAAYTAMHASTLEQVSATFNAARELAATWVAEAHEVATLKVDEFVAHNLNDSDDVSDELKAALNDKDGLLAALAAANEARISFLDSTEDKLAKAEKRAFNAVISELRDGEHRRNRERINEVSHLVRDIHRELIDELEASLDTDEL
jgi:hypothetical protein